MIRRWLLLSVAVVAFSPNLVRAQAKIRSTLVVLQDHDKMYEDVEIFRRILDRKLDPLYPQYDLHRLSTTVAPAHTLSQGQLFTTYRSTGAVNPTWLNSLAGPHDTLWIDLGNPAAFPNKTAYFLNEISSQQEARHPLEGVYLKGQGVVYTATLSSLQSAAADEPAKPVSEWESTRRQLRNEKEEPKKPAASKPPELSEVVLKVLAENGHHFSQLGENESLTVVITVHDSGPSTPKSGEGSVKAKSPSEEKDASVSSKVRDLELLGDLHMKQEHYGMARDAFREAIELKPGRKKTAALARKLTQAYLMLLNIKEAQAALNQAVALEEEDKDTKDKPAPATKSAAPLPVKLIVSAPKKWLDQVKEGKISFEEFRRQASVETLTFEGKRR